MIRDVFVNEARQVAPRLSDGRGRAYSIDHNSLLAAYPGPAMVVGFDSEIVAANAEANRLVAALAQDHAEQLRLLAATVVATRMPAAGHTMLPAGVGGVERAVFHLSGIPVSSSEQAAAGDADTRDLAIILARDVSMEHAMRLALADSRELYRDLARCSSDFAWQTDENGVFSFVSAKGALGFSAKALNGRSSLELINISAGMPDSIPFVTREPIEDIELVMTGAEGDERYCIVDALPTFDRDETWRGARGVCRDVTEEKLQQRTLDRLRAREEQVRAVLDATHRSLDPNVAFTKAARIVAEAGGFSQATILSIDKRGQFSALGHHRDDTVAPAKDGGPPEQRPQSVAKILRQFASDGAAGQMDGAHISAGGWLHHLARTEHGDTVNGAIWTTQRPKSTEELPEPSEPPESQSTDSEDRPLAQAIAHHIGIAIAHANQMQELESLARTDELTGLLNRRAFMDDLRRRQAHRYRVSRPGALLYVDLDNFKPVNDTFGHEMGDTVLREVATLLTTGSRAGDLCARLGGDEFALWLEDTDPAGARDKATLLLSEVKQLDRIAGADASQKVPPLGLSIGIAVTDPTVDETLEQLIKRADQAMYGAKQGGKNRYEIMDTHTATAALDGIDTREI